MEGQVEEKRLISLVPQRPNLDFALTAREILTFHGSYFGQNAKDRTRRAEELLEIFKLTDRADQLVRGFSGGMMQRLSIARAMMHDPEVLFLDEPSAGLDPQTRLLLWETIRDYNKRGKTIVLTTHYMDEADTLLRDHCHHRSRQSDRAGHARTIEGVDSRRLSAAPALRPGHAGAHRGLQDLPGVNEVRVTDSGADVYADSGGKLMGPIVGTANLMGVELHDVHISEPSLETLFLHHTGRSLRD